jgi:RNA polymerase sigma-70 factor (ECF subfamily)
MSNPTLLEQYRPLLTGHCYRMLGSVLDAEDAVQESMLRAWKALDRFDDRSSLQTWLYRIATNVCLDTLASSARRRSRPVESTSAPTRVRDDMPMPQREREYWVEPIPDVLALPADADTNPEVRAILRESIRLAFVAALQYLPPRQRAVLLLTQVLSWSAAEAAECLDMSVASVNSALQRARATMNARNPSILPPVLSAEQTALVARYVDAFESYDVHGPSRCRPTICGCRDTRPSRDGSRRSAVGARARCWSRWRRREDRRRSRNIVRAATYRGQF